MFPGEKKKKSSVVKELLVIAPYFVNSLNFIMPKKKKLKVPKYTAENKYTYISFLYISIIYISSICKIILTRK